MSGANTTDDVSVKVVVPIYSNILNPFERISLEHNWSVLKTHNFVFIRPSGLDISNIKKKFSGCGEEIFDDGYFNGISGYNRLMLSPEFYRRFSDTDYILVCQLDAYIFRDELLSWCKKEYDYIGAPWSAPALYRMPILRLWRRYFHSRRRTEKDFKVGNGGLSLRKVSSHIRATENLQDVVRAPLSKKGYSSNEDLFFALEVNKHGMDFSYPEYKEALQFSFDRYPALCYKENGYRLPFGCHAWYKEKMRDFWFPIIHPETLHCKITKDE